MYDFMVFKKNDKVPHLFGDSKVSWKQEVSLSLMQISVLIWLFTRFSRV